MGVGSRARSVRDGPLADRRVTAPGAPSASSLLVLACCVGTSNIFQGIVHLRLMDTWKRQLKNAPEFEYNAGANHIDIAKRMVCMKIEQEQLTDRMRAQQKDCLRKEDVVGVVERPATRPCGNPLPTTLNRLKRLWRGS